MLKGTDKYLKRCFMCDCEKWHWEMVEIKDIWQVHEFKGICQSCGDKANTFIGYWGKKKDKDKADLKSYLNSGLAVTRKYSALINGGYYD